MEEKMRVVVLGTGKVGATIVRKLSADGRFEVIAVDMVPNATLAGVARVEKLDVSSVEALKGFLNQGDVVVSALPYYLNGGVAEAAGAKGCHYLDLTESVESTRRVRATAENAQTAFIPQCGIAPGYIGILANDLASKFDSVERLSLRAGCVPVNPTNRLKYNVMWSMDGVVHEYCEPCDALRDGRSVQIAPLEDLEQLVIGGIALEAFNTSGGLGTLTETYNGKIRSMDYKSIRYPGHADLMKFLIEDLRFIDRQTDLRDLLLQNLATSLQDVIALQVVAIGERDGRRDQISASQLFRYKDEIGGTAIENTTASAICAMVDMLATKKLPQAGFVKQEQVKLSDFLASPFAAIYRDTPWC
jgi:saccharopine dehydrogenase-like NADP-dependent oxidoreductase